MNKTFDFSYLFRRISTWLALASLSATAGLGAYALMPGRAQDLFPDWALMALAAVAVGSAIGTPIATSFQQKGIPPKAGIPPAQK